jgi:hypothetical protein
MRSIMKVMMLDILGNSMPQRSLAKEDHSVEALILDRAHESFRERIQVGTSRWQRKRFDADSVTFPRESYQNLCE